MDDPNAMRHHAARMLENPAWAALLDSLRAQLDRERDSMPLGAADRHYVSIAETLLTRFQRRAQAMARPAALEDVNAIGAARRVAEGKK